MRVCYWLAILFIPFHSPAQSSDSTRSEYIKSYSDKFFLWPVLKQRSLNFELQNPKQLGNTLKFKPNNSYGFGLGMYLFDLGVEVVFAIPIDEEKESNFGKSSAQDLQLNILSRRWGADVFYQKYNGFYLTNPDQPLPPSGAFPQRPDFTTENFGVSGVYIFNHRKFSLRSAYTFADKQLKSQGSIIVGGTFNSFRLSADSSVLNAHYTARIGFTNSITSINYQTLSFAPGYAYNLVLKRFYVSGLLAFGPAVQWLSYRDLSDKSHAVNGVNTYADVRIATGYATDKFFAGITFATQVRNVQFENIQFSSNSSTVRILFGFRFKESGFLKNSVWDLLPPWGKQK